MKPPTKTLRYFLRKDYLYGIYKYWGRDIERIAFIIRVSESPKLREAIQVFGMIDFMEWRNARSGMLVHAEDWESYQLRTYGRVIED